jgi:hypothetical protein
MYLAQIARLRDNVGTCPYSGTDQVMMNRRTGKKRRNRDLILIPDPIAQDDDVHMVLYGFQNISFSCSSASLSRSGICRAIKHRAEHLRTEARILKLSIFLKIEFGKERRLETQKAAVLFRVLEKVALVPIYTCFDVTIDSRRASIGGSLPARKAA